MKNENFAERLFCDLKNAGIKIEKPEYVLNGARIGEVSNSFQMYVAGIRDKYSFNNGVALEIGYDNYKMTFTEAYAKLIEAIKELKHVKFYSLVIPRNGVVKAELEEFDKVISRYIKDYIPQDDEIYERWDVLVQKPS